jgi:hypothetical protein
MLILIKALVPRLTAISGSTRTDGVEIAPYMAVRHVLEPDEPPSLEELPSASVASDEVRR